MSKFKMFPWVPDGIYDYQDWVVRYRVADGMYTEVASIEWVNNQDKWGLLTEEFQKPWGFYPNFPPKPPKPS